MSLRAQCLRLIIETQSIYEFSFIAFVFVKLLLVKAPAAKKKYSLAKSF